MDQSPENGHTIGNEQTITTGWSGSEPVFQYSSLLPSVAGPAWHIAYSGNHLSRRASHKRENRSRSEQVVLPTLDLAGKAPAFGCWKNNCPVGPYPSGNPLCGLSSYKLSWSSRPITTMDAWGSSRGFHAGAVSGKTNVTTSSVAKLSATGQVLPSIAQTS